MSREARQQDAGIRTPRAVCKAQAQIRDLCTELSGKASQGVPRRQEVSSMSTQQRPCDAMVSRFSITRLLLTCTLLLLHHGQVGQRTTTCP